MFGDNLTHPEGCPVMVIDLFAPEGNYASLEVFRKGADLVCGNLESRLVVIVGFN